MKHENFEIPAAVRQKAVAQGAEGRNWLHRVASLFIELEHDWFFTVEATLAGGSESLVAAATTSSGEPVVLKVLMPPYGTYAGDTRTLAAADGSAHVRILKQDNERHAMLLEHLGPSLGVLGLSIENQMRILCDTLGEAWKIPAPLGLNTGTEKARWLRHFVTATWEELGAPCSARVIQQAINFAESRIAEFTRETSVLVHGDAHGANILSDPTHPGRFKLIDPDGLLAEPACDLAVPMREWSRELLSGDAFERGCERCGFLCQLTGVDLRAIWEWRFFERVSTGLLTMSIGNEQEGWEMLEVADTWTAV